MTKLVKHNRLNIFLEKNQDTPPVAQLLCDKNGRAIVACGFLLKYSEENMLKV